MTTDTIIVTSAEELDEALATVTGGETILLEAGDYGQLRLSDARFSSDVTIKSADANAMASFSQVAVLGSSNVTFDTIRFDYTYSSGDGTAANRFRVDNSDGITFTDSIFDGDFASGTGTSADGTGFGKALVVRGSTDIEIVRTEFFAWWKAVGILQSEDVSLIGNNIHTIRSDGITLGQVSGVLIENNYIHDFGGAAGSGDHRDMIQIQRSSGIGSSDIVIRNNILDMGAGDYTQGIWAGSDGADWEDPNALLRDVTIEGNFLYNAHTNGIALSLADGLTITNNTLVAVPREQTGGITIPKIIISSSASNVVIEQNIVSAVVGEEGQSDWSVQNNVYAQNTNPADPVYYDTQFVYYATSQTDGYNQFGVVSGSAADLLNAGSDLADIFPLDYETWVGASSSDVADDPGDAGDTSSTDSTQTGGDETDTGQGTEPDAGSDEADRDDTGPADPTSPMVFDDFVLDISGLPDNGQARLVDDAYVAQTETGPVIRFDGFKDQAKLGRLKQFEDSEQIAFEVEFARSEADGSAQRLVWNKGHVGLTLVKDGLKVDVRNTEKKSFRIDDLGLNDTDAHRITVMVDQATDRLQVLVDDQLVLDETETDFDFVGSNNGREWGWNIGFAFNRYADGDLSAFAIDDEVQFVDDVYTA